jgi:DNA-binding response OmpR family regulator
MNPTILYVEDDDALRYVTADNLEREHFTVIQCREGEEALELFDRQKTDICIIDIMLPKINGFDVAKRIRELNSDVPILFLSAKSLKEDRILGLTLGADDYIVKPFSIEELILKIKVFIKRSKAIPANLHNVYNLGCFVFDLKNQQLKGPDKIYKLTFREALVLGYFCRNQGQIVKRSDLLNEIWGDDDYFLGRSLDVFISRLRRRLRTDSSVIIENIHNVGFRLVL